MVSDTYGMTSLYMKIGRIARYTLNQVAKGSSKMVLRTRFILLNKCTADYRIQILTLRDVL